VSTSDAAWDGSQDVRLGDQVSAEFRGAPLLEVHGYSFWAPKNAVMTVQCFVDKSAKGLVPEVSLFTDMGVAVATGATQTGTTIKNFTVPESGGYFLKVRSSAGTGSYRLLTKAKYPPVIIGSSTNGTFKFDAPAGAVLGVIVKASKGSTAVPNITGLTFPGGAVDISATKAAKKAVKIGSPLAKLVKIGLLQSATYTLAFDPGTAGQSVDVKVSLVAPKTGRLWAPGYVEDPIGLPSAQRTEWMASPHGDHTAMAFNDWNDTNPPAVPGACSRCHTTSGYQSYIGFTGTQYATPAAQPIGQVITCDACHNEAASELTSVKFPSGTTVSGLGKEARCMMCHQGRESTSSVEAKITAAAPGTVDDAMSVGATPVSFMNVHYLAAGATLYGTQAMGGFEYPDPAKADPTKYYAVQGTAVQPRLQYEMKFAHVKGNIPSAEMDSCLGCHDSHSTEVRIDRCATCHVNDAGNVVANDTDLRDIRMAGTTADFDGDGVKKGVYYEIEGMRAVLLTAIKDYALAQFGKAIKYDSATYPYFLLDDGSNAKYPNWSARLLKAAYNYQFSGKDPGAFAHNAKYVIQLLHDSAKDLDASGKLQASTSAAVAKLVRNDSGHFDGSGEAYTDWDEDAIPSTAPPGGRGSTTGTDQMVNANCSRCHSVGGFDYIAASGVQITAVPSPRINGMYCESCHVDGADFAPQAHNKTPDQFGKKTPNRVYVARVNFPYVDVSIASATGSTAATIPGSTQAQIAAVTIFNGAKGTAQHDDSFVCMTCHRARESMLTLEAADVGGLTTNFTLSTKSPHYYPAGAFLYGSKAAVAWQYPGKTYVQRWDHDQAYNQPYALNAGVPVTASLKAQCTYCHMQDGSHSFEVEVGPATACGYCHPAATVGDLTPFARAQDNFDNDMATKPKAETKVFADRLAAAINAYSKLAKTNGTSGAEWSLFNDGSIPGTSVGWYKDTNHDDVLQTTEITSANAAKWDSKGYRATFNYRLWINDPGAWAHNPKYVLQILYDSIENLGGDLTNLTRPN
jgi:hypothetical protein